MGRKHVIDQDKNVPFFCKKYFFLFYWNYDVLWFYKTRFIIIKEYHVCLLLHSLAFITKKSCTCNKTKTYFGLEEWVLLASVQKSLIFPLKVIVFTLNQVLRNFFRETFFHFDIWIEEKYLLFCSLKLIDVHSLSPSTHLAQNWLKMIEQNCTQHVENWIQMVFQLWHELMTMIKSELLLNITRYLC